MAMIKRLVLKETQQDGIIRELEQEAAYLRNPAVVCVCNLKKKKQWGEDAALRGAIL